METLQKAKQKTNSKEVQFAGSPWNSAGTKFVIKPVLYCHCNLPDMKMKMICYDECKVWYDNDCESDVSSSPGEKREGKVR